jgi:5-methylcytosine-specific restriction endonuclease McrA
MPPGWPATRRRILARDGYRCRRCGAPATEVHHAIPGREDDAALESICGPCHDPITAVQAAAGRAAARP